MFIIYIILQISIIAKIVSIYPNLFNIIDTFKEHGIILGANITYISPNSHQCTIIKQKLINSQIHQLPLVSSINQTFFENFYINGTLKAQTESNYILSMIPISSETILAVVLFNNGNLAYIKKDNNNHLLVEQIQQISIDKILLQNPVYMFYLQTKKQILIILNKQLIKIPINVNESNIIVNNFNQNYDKFMITQNILFVEDLLFITRENELYVYSVNQEVVEKVFDYMKFAFNLDYIKVLFEKGIYKVFILNKHRGVSIYTYDPNLKKIDEISSFEKIPFEGYLIGVYNQILMVVDEVNNDSLVYEFHYSKQFNKWFLFNTHTIQQQVKDIQFTKNYAILIGLNVHQIIYHSIPTHYFKGKNYITIPGLQQIYVLNNQGNSNTSLIGITKHTFYTFQLSLSPQKIKCNYNNDLTPIQFTYYQNSTKCSKLSLEEENKFCIFISNYTINYIYPIITSKYKIQLISISFIFILILLIIAKKIHNKYFMTQESPQKIQEENSKITSPTNAEERPFNIFSNLQSSLNNNKFSNNNDASQSENTINQYHHKQQYEVELSPL